MNFNSSDRAVLAALADILIPCSEDGCSASTAGVSGESLDRLLAVRPDLISGLKEILNAASGRDAAEVVAALQQKDAAKFGVLSEIVAGAYFQSEQVRGELGYRGQTAKPIDPRPDYLEDGLLQSVIDRGPIYRATPCKKPE